MIFHIYANAADFGCIEADSEEQALDKAAQMAGYDSVAHMEKMLDAKHEFVAKNI